MGTQVTEYLGDKEILSTPVLKSIDEMGPWWIAVTR